MSKELAAQLLKNRDALDNISEIRTRLQREKTAVDSQLQAGVDAQLQLLASANRALAGARTNIDSIKQNMSEVHGAHQQSSRAVRDFDKLKELSRVVTNFDLTQKFLDNFETLHEDLEKIAQMMDSDGDFEEVDSQMPYLLPTHYALDQLRQVKEQAEFYARKSSEDVRQTIRRHFGPLDAMVSRFDTTIMNIADALLDIALLGDPSLIVRVSKIIDFEEKKDLIATSSASMGGPRSPGAPEAPLVHHTVRDYPKRFLAAVQSAAESKFNAYLETFSPEDRPDKLLDKMTWVFRDLQVVRKELVPKVPDRWSIFDVYLRFYHDGVDKVLKAIMSYEPPAAVILSLLEWVKEYYLTMEKVFHVKKDQLARPLLDGRESELYDDFLDLLVRKLKDWYKTVSVQEKKPFIVRSTAPDSLHDNKLALNAHTDMAKLVSQQLEAAAESGQGRIVLGCVNACCDVLQQRQQEWISLVDAEVGKEISGTVEDVPPGLFEYLVALANEQDRAHELLTDLSAKWSEPLGRKHKNLAIAKFEETGDGFTDVALAAVRGMVDLIFNDLNAAFGELFTGKSWKNGTVATQIANTLAEYLEDAFVMMLSDLFIVLIERLTRDTVLAYLRAMTRAQGKIKVPDGRDRILEDVKALYNAFSNPDYEVDPEIIRPYFKVFGVVTEVLDAPQDELVSKFHELREMYWDAPLDLYEYMVALRKDLDKKDVREIMARVRQAAVQAPTAEDGEQLDELQKTFLSGFRK